MGILSNHLTFAEDVEFDVATATPEISPHVYRFDDLLTGNTGIVLGANGRINGRIRVTEAFDSAGDGASLNIAFVSSAAEALTTPNTHWDHTYAEADLALASVFDFTLPIGNNPAWLEYVGFRMTASGEDITDGSLTLLLMGDGGPAVHPGYVTGKVFHQPS
jgi:hypothetical protein